MRRPISYGYGIKIITVSAFARSASSTNINTSMTSYSSNVCKLQILWNGQALNKSLQTSDCNTGYTLRRRSVLPPSVSCHPAKTDTRFIDPGRDDRLSWSEQREWLPCYWKKDEYWKNRVQMWIKQTVDYLQTLPVLLKPSRLSNVIWSVTCLDIKTNKQCDWV